MPEGVGPVGVKTPPTWPMGMSEPSSACTMLPRLDMASYAPIERRMRMTASSPSSASSDVYLSPVRTCVGRRDRVDAHGWMAMMTGTVTMQNFQAKTPRRTLTSILRLMPLSSTT